MVGLLIWAFVLGLLITIAVLVITDDGPSIAG